MSNPAFSVGHTKEEPWALGFTAVPLLATEINGVRAYRYEMQTPADQLAELDVRIANTRRRLMEAESSLSEMRAHGLPTRAIETSIEIMTDVLESMDRRRRLIKLEMDDQNRV